MINILKIGKNLNQTQRLMIDSVKAFCQSELKPRVINDYKNEVVDKTIFKKFGDMGIFGPTINGYGCLGESYKTLSKIGFFLVPVAFLLAVIASNFFVLGSMIVFGGLALTRVLLISLLDYTGMAPVSALYLFSGSVMWFCMVGLAVGYLSDFVLRKVVPGTA